MRHTQLAVTQFFTLSRSKPRRFEHVYSHLHSIHGYRLFAVLTLVLLQNLWLLHQPHVRPFRKQIRKYSIYGSQTRSSFEQTSQEPLLVWLNVHGWTLEVLIRRMLACIYVERKKWPCRTRSKYWIFVMELLQLLGSISRLLDTLLPIFSNVSYLEPVLYSELCCASFVKHTRYTNYPWKEGNGFQNPGGREVKIDLILHAPKYIINQPRAPVHGNFLSLCAISHIFELFCIQVNA